MAEKTEAGSKDPTTPQQSLADGTEVFDCTGQKNLGDFHFAEIPDCPPEFAVGSAFAGYRILRKIGQGGMGAVYLAASDRANRNVALKVLSRSVSSRPDAVRRFHKEAMTLARVKSPYVTELLENGECDGWHFIASEFIQGDDAGKYLSKFGVPDPDTAITIFRHIATALCAMHRCGMIHRDVKPENILLEYDRSERSERAPAVRSARLSDFGLAKMMEQTESMQITRSMMIMGTPRYMPPEQFASTRDTDQRADIYSLGATMYFLLTGQFLFAGSDIVSLAHSHRTAFHRPACLVNRDINPGLSRIVDRCLEKLPENRYQTSADLLAELERLEEGLPLAAGSGARVPVAENPSGVHEFTWQFPVTPQAIWSQISHTDRINRLLGLPPAVFTRTTRAGGESVTMAEAKFAGMKLRWREHPFTWIENREMTVFREFESGPFRWVCSRVAIQPNEVGGCQLIHRIEYLHRSLPGKYVAAFQVGFVTRRKLDRIYRRIVEKVQVDSPNQLLLNFTESVKSRSGAQQTAFERAARWMVEQGVESSLVADIDRFLMEGFDSEVARLQPRVLARRFGRDERSVIEASIMGVPAGLLLMSWDVICPRCRVAAEFRDSLEMIRGHANCGTCQADFEIDLVNNVELVFRVHPEIRPTDLRTYCIGGPFHAPHVIAQLRLEAGQQYSLDLSLGPGEYQVTGPQWIQPAIVLVQSGEQTDFASIPVVDPPRLTTLRPGSQILTIVNDSPDALYCRLERGHSEQLSLTAARALTLEKFRKYLPDQIVSADQLVSVSEACVMNVRIGGEDGLFSELDSGDALKATLAFLKSTIEKVRRAEGDVVSKGPGNLVALFQQTRFVMEAAFEILRNSEAGGFGNSPLRIVLHRGSIILTSVEGGIHYTGEAISKVIRLGNTEFRSGAGWSGLAMTPEFAAMLSSQQLQACAGLVEQFLHKSASSGKPDEFVWHVPTAGLSSDPDQR